MKQYDFILALDPSGAFREGKGTTGWCLFDCKANRLATGGSISALKHACMESYWQAHMDLIDKYAAGKRILIVIEDYIVYAQKAEAHINTHMETSKLIGCVQLHCWLKKIPYIMQLAAEVKPRWTDAILNWKEYIIKSGRGYAIPATKEPINRHCMDSIRHAVHAATFKNKEK